MSTNYPTSFNDLAHPDTSGQYEEDQHHRRPPEMQSNGVHANPLNGKVANLLSGAITASSDALAKEVMDVAMRYRDEANALYDLTEKWVSKMKSEAASIAKEVSDNHTKLQQVWSDLQTMQAKLPITRA